MTGPRPQAVHLHIDELVLHGFAPQDRRGIVEALTRELTSAIGRDGISPWPAPSTLRQADGGEFMLTSARRATLAGEGIAHAIHASLHR